MLSSQGIQVTCKLLIKFSVRKYMPKLKYFEICLVICSDMLKVFLNRQYFHLNILKFFIFGVLFHIAFELQL